MVFEKVWRKTSIRVSNTSRSIENIALSFQLRNRSTEYDSQNYETASYGQQQQQHPSQDYISMLIEESEKLYTSLIKEWVDKSITYYTFSSPQS